MEPTFTNSKLKWEEHVRFLLSQTMRDFQEVNEVIIDKIEFIIVNGSLEKVKVKLK